MKSFPMFFKTTGRRVVVLGGGEQAAQKTRLLMKSDAEIHIFADNLEPELQALANEGRITWQTGAITPERIQGAAFAFVANGCPGLDAALHDLVRLAHVPVNVVDQPHLCEITTPSLVDRSPVVVAIGTEGAAPVLARQIKTRMEDMLAPNLGGLAAFAGLMRDEVAFRVARPKRRAFWSWVFNSAPKQIWTSGSERKAAGLIKEAIASGGAPKEAQSGKLSVILGADKAPDLMTLRAVNRLQEADILAYVDDVTSEILDLARRDAERMAWDASMEFSVFEDSLREGHQIVLLAKDEQSLSFAPEHSHMIEWLPKAH